MLDGLPQKILDHVDGRRFSGAKVVVGFDVFDTVVTRLIPKEQSLEVMCRAIATELLGDGRRFDAVRTAYVEAYRESASRNAAVGLDFEASTDQLFERWLKGLKILGSKATRQDLDSCIVDLESALLTPMPQAVGLLNALAVRGVPAIFVSDMYLGRHIVEQLLRRLGLASSFRSGYVSSDYGLLKRTGNIFPKVLALEGLQPDELVFVGDDELPDVVQPSKLGIKAFHFVFDALEHERTSLRTAFNEGHGEPRQLARAVLQAAGGPEFLNRSAEEFATNKYLGPYFASFAFAVQQQYAKNDFGRILFAAREGHLLLRLTDCFDTWFPFRGKRHKIYLPASRLSALAFSFGKEPFGMIDVANLIKNGEPTLRTLLSFLRLDEKRLKAFATEVGFVGPDVYLPVDLINWAPIYRVIDSVNALPEFQAFRDEGDLFLQWMQQQGILDGKRKLFIDLGWSAQIQDSLSRGFERRGIDIDIRGYYSGLRLQAHWRQRPGSTVAWYHCDECSDDTISKAPLWFPQILETVCRAPHGTVAGFERTDNAGIISPRFKTDRPKTEIEDDSLISRLHELAIAYAKRLAHLCAIYNLNPSDLRDAANELVFKFLMAPEVEVSRRLSGFCNVSDLGSTTVFQYRGGMGEPGYDEERFQDIERTTLWPSGAAAGFFGEDAAHDYAEQYIRLRARHGDLKRHGGFTLFNPGASDDPKVLAVRPKLESVVAASPEAVVAWRARFDAISTHVGSEAARHRRQEIRFKRAYGTLGLSAEARRRLRDLVARGEDQPNVMSWPRHGGGQGQANAGQIRQLQAKFEAAHRLAEERYRAIVNMDKMIKERDATITAQEKMCLDRWDTIQEMDAMIRERDERIQGRRKSKGNGRILGRWRP